ncbi:MULTISPECIES: hypothetical protein [unclassified Paenibacillus]|uniref:hypothetical protein n=1 Tax=unclassified Paenibacillus TaxID=185978 RepID=UPI00362DABD4
MDKSSIVYRLLELPAEIAAAETKLLDANALLLGAKAELQHKEDGLYVGVFEDDGMKIDGKNAEIRNAQLRQFTEVERHAVAAAEDGVAIQKHHLNKLLNEFKALQSVADLLKGAA